MKKRRFLAAALVLGMLLSGCSAYRHRSGNDAAAAVSEQTAPFYRISDCHAEEYSMDLTLDTQNNAVYGTSVVKLTNTSDTALDELCFRLYSANISSGSINSASNDETGNGYTVETKKDPSVIYLSLNGDSIQPGASLSVKLDFRSEIPEIDDRLGCHAEEKGKLYNMTFCFPQLALLEDGQWFETEYSGNGESYCYEMTNYHVTLAAPTDYVVLSSGKSETVDGKTVIEAPNVREMAICACNYAQVKSLESNGITYNILTPDYSGYEAQYLADFYDTLLTVAVEAAEMYSAKVGPYIYDELDIIPMRFDGFGGMEMPGLVQVMIPDAADEEEPYNRLCSVSAVATAHEVGHQWFYCAVSNDTSLEPWLDESFTSYLEYLYWDQFVTGKEAVNTFNSQYAPNAEYDESAIRFDSAEGIECEDYINLPINDYPGNSYAMVVYDEGAWFLRELELAMGSDRFFEMLGNWYQENLNQIVTGRAFIVHVLEHDSSQAVRDVINEYIWEKAI